MKTAILNIINRVLAQEGQGIDPATAGRIRREVLAWALAKVGPGVTALEGRDVLDIRIEASRRCRAARSYRNSSSGTNEKRADRGAAAVLSAYAVEALAESAETVIGDLLADLLHLADRTGLDPQSILKTGWTRYIGDHEDGDPAATLEGTDGPFVGVAFGGH